MYERIMSTKIKAITSPPSKEELSKRNNIKIDEYSINKFFE